MKKEKKTVYSMWQNTKYMLSAILECGKRIIWIDVLTAVFSICAPLTSIVLLKVLIDSITSSVSIQMLLTCVLVFAAVNAVIGIGQMYLQKTESVFSDELRFMLFHRMSRKILYTDYERLESLEGRKNYYNAWEFTHNGNANAINNTFVSLISACLGAFSLGGVILYASPVLILTTVVVTGLSYIINRQIRRLDQERMHEVIFYYKKVDYLTFGKPVDHKAGKDIRIYNIGGWFNSLLDLMTADLQRFHSVFMKKFSVWHLLCGFLLILREGVIFAVLISMTRQGKMTVGDFAFYYNVIKGFAQWMGNMEIQFGVLDRLCISCDDYRRFLDMPDKKFFKGKQPVPDVIESIEFDDVCFSYDGKKNAVDHISFYADKGKKTAIVGMNGAGKTTCMKLLSGLYTPDSGCIRINGIDVREFSKEAYFDLFSVVFQDAFTLPISIAENISLREDLSLQNIDRVLERAQLYDRVHRFPDGAHTMLNKELNHDAAELSGGEMQKLFLARALYKDAPIIILDEPTAALDPIAENELYLQYNEMTKNKTSFYISHRLSSTGFCDNILFFEDGQIIETGTHSRLMQKRGKYSEMFAAQSHYYKEKSQVGVHDEV